MAGPPGSRIVVSVKGGPPAPDQDQLLLEGRAQTVAVQVTSSVVVSLEMNVTRTSSPWAVPWVLVPPVKHSCMPGLSCLNKMLPASGCRVTARSQAAAAGLPVTAAAWSDVLN